MSNNPETIRTILPAWPQKRQAMQTSDIHHPPFFSQDQASAHRIQPDRRGLKSHFLLSFFLQ